MRGRVLILLVLLVLSCAGLSKLDKSVVELPKNFPPVVYDFNKNPLSSAKIALGRALYHDPALSRDSTVSCTSCHLQFTAFTHTDHDVSHGIEDRKGTRNSPTLINLAWQNKFMWDGAIHHLDVQALAPIAHPAEMDYDIGKVAQRLGKSEVYRKLFKEAYRDTAITGERILKSLAAFQLTFISANSKYDLVIAGKAQFDEKEAKGYALFKAHCASCHAEPLFTTHGFANNGLPPNIAFNDLGRYQITKIPTDSFLFKIPTLRNIEFSYPYMHDGRFKTIGQVLKHYSSGVANSGTLSPSLRGGIKLSSDERVELTAFLLTLTDKAFLFNTAFSYPKDIFPLK